MILITLLLPKFNLFVIYEIVTVNGVNVYVHGNLTAFILQFNGKLS